MGRARLEQDYIKTFRPELEKELGKKNIMEVPKLKKIVLNVGSKEAVSDSRILDKIKDMLQKIAGQLPVRRKAKKSIAGFKLREGMPIGIKVTLRKHRMYEFLDRLVNLALPKVRDFQGLSSKLDGQGNYNIGIKEWNIFPEADIPDALVHGLNITIQTSAKTDDDGRALLNKFGMPFKKNNN